MERAQELKDLKDNYKAALNTPAGKQVVNDLMEKCYFAKRMYDDNPNVLYFREGRRDLILYILNLLQD
jgi:hypothetical protein